MPGEIGEILKQSKPARVLMAEKQVTQTLVNLLRFCDLHDCCFEECLEQAETLFVQAVDPPAAWKEAKDGLRQL